MADKRHFIHNTDIGQNFLIDRGVVEFILKRSEPAAGDVVLEIGPGDGILTRGLLTTPLAALYSVEVDDRLRDGIERIAAHDGRYRCFWGDAVRFDYVRDLPEMPANNILANPFTCARPPRT